LSGRKALIIVVPESTTDDNLNLPAVRSDAEDLTIALRQSSYDVTAIGTIAPSEVSAGSIRRAVRLACRDAPTDGTLLIFFSGHGLHVGGRDYIVPADADLQDTALVDYLIGIGDVAKWVDESKAKQIVFFVDACREGILGKKGLAQWGSELRRHASQRQYSIVFSCRPGQYSYYVSGRASGFSLFSNALAQTLAIDNPARTLGQVIDSTQKLMLSLAREHDKGSQTISLQTETSATGDPRDQIICDGSVTRGDGRPSDNWGDAVRHSRLWYQLESSEPGKAGLSEFREYAVKIADEAESCFKAAAGGLGDDPWRDPKYPIRVVRRLEEITADGGLVKLTSPEVALLLMAPFVREHVYAAALRSLLPAFPTQVEVDIAGMPAQASAARLGIEATYRSHPQLMRRVRKLVTSPNGPDIASEETALAGRNVMLWLLHRHLSRFAAMWHAAPDGTLTDNVAGGSPKSGGTASALGREALSQDRILKLAKCVRSEPDRLTRRDVPQPLEPSVLAGPGAESIRERLLGSLLCLAGWMAIDVRAAGEVVVDHVGIRDPLDPADFTRLAGEAVWTPVGRGLELKIACPHPAIDYALHELVNRANQILASVLRVLIETEQLQAIAAGLPGQLSGGRIVPVVRDGVPAYDTPHQKFHLAQEEIRELLMGEQLYGDPSLAIRELYQNALDACRYRQARLEYLARLGKRKDWRGKIVFRQGADNGRAFIECQDNGVGMGLNEIESCFSRAGRRFADLPDFIEEQELWLQCEPKIEMTPNSQFGIGVLSYFMIADEIEVQTCRMGRDGENGNEIRLRIPGSGSLFRVQTGGKGDQAGTRIRLYLREDWKKTCRDALEKVLFIAEFETEVDDGQTSLKWLPGIPRGTGYIRTDDEDFWWTNTPGADHFLSDGLLTSVRPSDPILRSDPYRYRVDVGPGALINLKRERRPRLTVDRKMILDFDREWVASAYLRQSRFLLSAPWLRYTWFWRLPEQLKRILEVPLVAADLKIPIGTPDELAKLAIFGGTSGSEKNEDILINFGYPVRILGLNTEDADVVLFLVEVQTAETYMEKLMLLRQLARGEYVSTFDLPIPRGANEESDAAAMLESLSKEMTLAKLAPFYRAALYVAMGFPSSDWLVPFLPTVDIDESSAATRLQRLQEEDPDKARDDDDRREGKIDADQRSWLRSHVSEVVDWIEAALNALPQWLAVTVFFGFIAIMGHFAIEGLEYLTLIVWTWLSGR
jgi:Caspase domain